MNYSEGDYILIEDFQIISHLGLILHDINSKILMEEKGDKEFEGFCHFIRTERQVFGSIYNFFLFLCVLFFWGIRGCTEC